MYMLLGMITIETNTTYVSFNKRSKNTFDNTNSLNMI